MKPTFFNYIKYGFGLVASTSILGVLIVIYAASIDAMRKGDGAFPLWLSSFLVFIYTVILTIDYFNWRKNVLSDKERKS